MANIRPFRAFRPAMGLEGKVAALPYDVFSREEAREYEKKHPDSFLAIDRAESVLPEEVGTYEDVVYAKAAEMLKQEMEDGTFLQDQKPCFYLYEQTWQGRSQTGITACASIDDYESGVIKKHENTVEAKEQDRIRHVDTCNAQTGPIFLAYRDNEAIDAVTRRVKEQTPVCDFISAGEVRNRVWVISEESEKPLQALTGFISQTDITAPRLQSGSGRNGAWRIPGIPERKRLISFSASCSRKAS